MTLTGENRRPSPRALLVHGMGRTPASMVVLATRLFRAGMRSSLFGYLSALESYDAIVARLSKRIAVIAAQGPYIAVGHSLGGLLLRSALDRVAGDLPRPIRLFMLATPNRPPRLAHWIGGNFLYRLYTGDSGQLLADHDRMAAIPKPPSSYTIIAGVGGSRGDWSPFRGTPNDWIVGLDEVTVANGEDLITVPSGHTFLMSRKEVARAIIERVATRR